MTRNAFLAALEQLLAPLPESERKDALSYYEDYLEGYERGVQLSLDLGLYRQPYCGCVFSERDRYYQPWHYEHKDTGSLVTITKNIAEIR